jgi:probable HAF family extracellular repeat protein
LQHAFFYAGGVITDIHNYLGVDPAWRGFATSINDHGQAVGAYVPGGTGPRRAFLFDSALGTSLTLGTLGGQYTSPGEINNNGEVVGNATLPGDTVWHAFLYSNGTMTDLNVLTGYGTFTARSINNSGDIVGETSGSSYLAFVYSNGVMTNIGDLGGSVTNTQDINDSGQVVGSSYLSGDVVDHAFLYSNGVMTDIGVLIPGAVNSTATGINNNGDIVGQYYTGPGLSGLNPFLYSGGIMQNLNVLLPPGSGWTLLYARDINDYGQIVGVGTINGENHGFLMTPGC